MLFLKEEKSEHERARTFMLAVQLCCARHCELPLSKMGIKGLFPGVAVPLAFFCTLFFRHRKKSVSAPWDGKSQFAPESARQAPSRGIFHGKVVAYRCKQGAFRSPPVPFSSPLEAIERSIGLQALLPRRCVGASDHRRGRRMRPQVPHSAEFPLAQRNDFRYTLGNRAATVPRPPSKDSGPRLRAFF